MTRLTRPVACRADRQAVAQTLEARRLLAVDLTPRGVLQVTGTDAADVIDIAFDADAPTITVTGASAEPATFPARRVRFVQVRAGDGDDIVTVGDLRQPVLVRLGEGNDTLGTGARRTLGSGGPGDDTLTADVENAGGGGQNGRLGRGGPRASVVLVGGDGDDVLTGSANVRANALIGRAGNDELIGGAGDRTINLMDGGDGDDTLIGAAGRDVMRGGDGNDTLFGRAGNDLMSGGDGDDALFGEDGDDTLDGGLGQDTLDGGSGDNVLRDPDQ